MSRVLARAKVVLEVHRLARKNAEAGVPASRDEITEWINEVWSHVERMDTNHDGVCARCGSPLSIDPDRWPDSMEPVHEDGAR